ncbi:MAG: DUF1573 domain-containing protein [Bacteroidales bacterium]|nr:DUF1573 domain-containing protein [Bacteroidales bacterium]
MRRFLLTIPILSLFLIEVQAQPYFDRNSWDFGSINEEDGVVSHVFSFFNRTDNAVRITGSVPSCTCIMAQLPNEPVAPGQSADIVVFFSPSGAVGPTHRTVEILGPKGSSLGILSTDADVTPADRSIEERYRIVLAPCLYANMDTVPFGYMEPGEKSSKVIYFANSSKERMYLSFSQSGSGLMQVQCPPVIGPGNEVAVMLTYSMPSDENFVSRYDTLSVRVEGSEMVGRICTSAICLTKGRDGTHSPKLRVYPGIAELKTQPFRRIGRGIVEISNDGSEELVINGTEMPSGVSFSLHAGSTIAPGKTVKAELSSPEGMQSVVVRLFTNDPKRPYKDIIFN